MRRRLFNLLALGSLLMLGIVVLFWVRSYGSGEHVNLRGVSRYHQLITINGLFKYCVSTPLRHRLDAMGQGGFVWRILGGDYWRGTFLGFDFEHYRWSHYGTRGSQVIITVPFWFLVLIFSTLPLIVLYRLIRKRNRNPFACISCGYDLRATPDRCPECGAIVNRIP